MKHEEIMRTITFLPLFSKIYFKKVLKFEMGCVLRGQKTK
jgi:hypothetical protein